MTTNIPDPSTCIDDGDCTNGEEQWDAATCSCEIIPVVFGCTNMTANNYNPAATCDDGTCDFDCPDPGTCDNGDCSDGEEVWDGTNCECISINVPDPSTCVDDGDCSNGTEEWDDDNCMCISVNIPDPSTCVDDGDCNNGTEEWDDANCMCIAVDVPDSSTCIDDGDCTNGTETWNIQTCECEVIQEVLGCTNASANNFDSNATCDDGSCEFDCPDPGNCDNGDCSDGEEIWDGNTCECISINVPDPSTCVDDGDCTNGVETWNDTTCECDLVALELGCTNMAANNYDPNAECDDGSCEFDCPDPGNCDNGDCTDGEEVWDGVACECISINVPDPTTCVDDGDCTNGIETWDDTLCDCNIVMQELGCTNMSANNYDPNATCDDGSCEFDCPDPGNCDNGDCSDGEEIWDGVECECISINMPTPCVDDGDCSNGEEVWNQTSCECEVVNLIDPDTCVDDGDCTNGIEVWDNEICECIIEDTPNCDTGTLIEMVCDDFDPCTENDVQMMVECSGEVCMPCLGTPIDCEAEENIMEVPCDDLDDNTVDDVETILICDNSVCIPCEGVLKVPSIFYPQIFTPDGDGNNDEFRLFSDVDFNVEEFAIYDRWGEVMYRRENLLSSDSSLSWDGRFNGQLVPPGVYVYYIKLGEPFGEVEVGDITIVY